MVMWKKPPEPSKDLIDRRRTQGVHPGKHPATLTNIQRRIKNMSPEELKAAIEGVFEYNRHYGAKKYGSRGGF